MVERGVDGAPDHKTRRRAQRAGADHVDDYAAAAFFHQRNDFAGHPHVAEELERPVFHPRFIAELQELAGAGAAGVVDQDIDAAVNGLAAFDHRFDLVSASQIGGRGCDPAGRAGTGRRDGFIQLLLAACAYQHRSSFVHERQRDGPADSLAASGYDRNLAA